MFRCQHVGRRVFSSSLAVRTLLRDPRAASEQRPLRVRHEGEACVLRFIKKAEDQGDHSFCGGPQTALAGAGLDYGIER
jgi:hypothetical protein